MSQTYTQTGANPINKYPIHFSPSSPISPLLGNLQTPSSSSSNSDPLTLSLISTITSSSSTNSSFNSPISSNSSMGNICSNRVPNTGLDPKVSVMYTSEESDYGEGSVISRVESLKNAMKAGNEEYNDGRHKEALEFYQKAVRLYPKYASSRMNCVDALVELGRFSEAFKECEEVIRLDPVNGRAYYKLTVISLRIGLLELAREYITSAYPEAQKGLFEKLQKIEDHLQKGADARIVRDWETALKEVDASIAAGSNSSKYILAFRAEMLLHQHKFELAQETLFKAVELEISIPSKSEFINTKCKFLGMVPDSYFGTVQAQIDMAFARFASAVEAVNRAHTSDSSNTEVYTVRKNVKLTSWAYRRGIDFFEKKKYVEALGWFEEGLKYDMCNFIIWCNMADCFWKLENLEKCVECCNQSLEIRPNCTKALLRRAASFAQPGKWAECVSDYETVLKNTKGDVEIAEALIQAKIALSLQNMKDYANSKLERSVEEIRNLEQFKVAILMHGICLIYFMIPMNPLCDDVSLFVDSLPALYPSIQFIKVDIHQNDEIAKNENVRIAPTFKIYENGKMMKEMIRPSRRDIESSVMNYCI